MHTMKSLILKIICTLMPMTLVSMAHADEFNLDLFQLDSGNFYVNATEGVNTETSLLLDTGSSYVSLSKATFERVSKTASPRFSRHIYGRMANGKVEKVEMYVLEELHLADNCVLKDIEVAVFPRADRDILGLNALAKLQPFTMQLFPPRLSSNACAA